jgi:hypothetical protein
VKNELDLYALNHEPQRAGFQSRVFAQPIQCLTSSDGALRCKKLSKIVGCEKHIEQST